MIDASIRKVGGVMGDLVRWSDEADEVISGDITAAAAYLTPAGGVVVTAVGPGLGSWQRDAGLVGFTTSLGFGRKLDRIIRDPRVALAYHAREHGFSASPVFVLAQGRAAVDLTPSRDRLEALVPRGEWFYGEARRGPVWDRLLREYYYERVLVDITLQRVMTWPNLSASTFSWDPTDCSPRQACGRPATRAKANGCSGWPGRNKPKPLESGWSPSTGRASRATSGQVV